jgi:hypothetical protein
MMRSLPVALILIALTGCSSKQEVSEQHSAKVEEAPAAPNVSLTAAPGVAFDYRYAFSLAPTAVAAAQEEHAQACERLGINRCRITGMRYQLFGENDIQGMLSFKLDPAIAREFGKNGIAKVQAMKGRLVDAEISGTDVGEAIDRSAEARTAAAADLKRTEARLAARGVRESETAELRTQRDELRRSIAASTASIADSRASLATTPMTFRYRSGDAVRGFDASAPITSALDTVVASTQTTVAIILGLIAVFGPPALALGLLWLLWRRFGAPFRRRYRARQAVSED